MTLKKAEIHPFEAFVPPKARYLILGSFVSNARDPSYDWYYSSKRNQFWPIIEKVYKTKLADKKAKQNLFRKLNIAITDIIVSCQRRDGNSLDANLINCVYNIDGIGKILKEDKIEKIYFTSRFVEKQFKKRFKTDITLVTLPSPSPRYAKLSFNEKVRRYRNLLL